ncbi:MAG: hypothetical protein F6K14_10755 [Symploca sp. SIO2C1]|nr:hypothetical protein [Symploca sp. SIO2C1]
MLNFFNNLSSRGKVLLGFFLAGLMFAGLLSVDYLTPLITSSDSLVKVELLVQTEDNQPIQDAKIQFISRGSPTTKYTTVSGYAEIKIPLRESVEINITKEGYETFVDRINLEVDTDTNKKFKLKSLNSSSKTINYQYYTSQNDFFPLILSSLRPDLNIPIIKRVLEHIHIDKIPLIARNDVFESIERFKVESGNQRTIQEAIDGRYGFEASDPEQIDSSSFFIPNETRVLEDSSTNQLSDRLGEDQFCYFSYAPLLGSFQTADDNIKYTAFIQYDNADEYGSIIQYPKLSDLAKYGKGDFNCIDNVRDTWIKKIIKNNQDIRGFLGFDYDFIFDLQNQRPYCPFSWALKRITPSPYVKFIDVINNNQEAIRIESINYESINKDPYQLTVADQRSVLFKSSFGLTKKINILLQPANHLLIPIEFGFNTQPVKEVYQLYDDMKKSKLLKAEEIYVRKPLSKVEFEKENKVTNFNQFNKINMSLVNISEDFINGASSLTDLFNSIPRRLAVGTILNVKSLKINGQTINIDPPSDEPTVYISTLLGGAGSCPYLVVYDDQQESWLELGTILSARKNKPLQQEELHHLRKSVSKIKIEEREPEITYIDALSIIYTEPNTEEVQAVVYPTPELQKVDEDYFLLHQGEALEIDLEKFVPPNASDVMLKINGYYKALQTSLS